MWTLAGAVALLLASIAATQTPADSGAKEQPAPVGRMREAVRRPALEIPPLPDLMPTFRLTVEENTFPRETVLEGMRRDLAERPGPGPAAAGGVDILGLAMQLVHGLNEARRRNAEANARRRVEEALAQFCASHDCSVTESGIGPHEGVIVPSKPR